MKNKINSPPASANGLRGFQPPHFAADVKKQDHLPELLLATGANGDGTSWNSEIWVRIFACLDSLAGNTNCASVLANPCVHFSPSTLFSLSSPKRLGLDCPFIAKLT